jgi:ABC-type transporter Mla maintaining outer membrane lipid asymmetry ATPase subunit MlaF
VKKAASILRAFALRPQVIILNDPTQGLSREHLPQLLQLIEEHKKLHHLKILIITSDDLELINLLPGHIITLQSVTKNPPSEGVEK